MCGRYHVDEETAKEIEKIIQLTEENVRKRASINFQMQARDLHPTEIAPVLTASGSGLECSMKRWGLPGFQGKQVIFNARSESVLDKKTFQEGVAYRRIVIPAAWFYEWNRYKEKNIFYRKGKPVLFMAGIYNHYEDGDRFTILTTTVATVSMTVCRLCWRRANLSHGYLTGAKRVNCFKKYRVCWSERQSMNS